MASMRTLAETVHATDCPLSHPEQAGWHGGCVSAVDSMVLELAAHKRCRGCGELAMAHCFGCNACPEQECPDWCGDESV